MTSQVRNVIMDCDTGGDDAIALMMLLRHHVEEKVNVIGITCVNGNTPLDNVVHNNLRMLKLFGLEKKIPLFAGCRDPLVPLSVYDTESIFGKDGLGDCPDMEPIRSDDDLVLVKGKHASQAIVDLSREFPDKLDVIATGPLTNLAVALRLDPELPKRVENIFIMGGTRNGVGNITPAAEYNFYVDPEAAFTVLREFTQTETCKCHLIDFELTLNNSLPKDWVLNDWLGGSSEGKTHKQEFALMVLKPLIKFYKEVVKTDNQVICDSYAMAIALDPEIGLNPVGLEVCVETGGNFSRGHLIWNRTGEKHQHFHGPLVLYGGVAMEKYKQMLRDAVA